MWSINHASAVLLRFFNDGWLFQPWFQSFCPTVISGKPRQCSSAAIIINAVTGITGSFKHPGQQESVRGNQMFECHWGHLLSEALQRQHKQAASVVMEPFGSLRSDVFPIKYFLIQQWSFGSAVLQTAVSTSKLYSHTGRIGNLIGWFFHFDTRDWYDR